MGDVWFVRVGRNWWVLNQNAVFPNRCNGIVIKFAILSCCNMGWKNSGWFLASLRHCERRCMHRQSNLRSKKPKNRKTVVQIGTNFHSTLASRRIRDGLPPTLFLIPIMSYFITQSVDFSVAFHHQFTLLFICSPSRSQAHYLKHPFFLIHIHLSTHITNYPILSIVTQFHHPKPAPFFFQQKSNRKGIHYSPPQSYQHHPLHLINYHQLG